MVRTVLWSASAALFAVVTAAAQGSGARPGAVNFVEGQVTLEGVPLAPGAIEGSEVASGKTLATGQGKAEVLLTPGAFLRLSDHGEIRMLSQSGAGPRVELLRGVALLEVVQPGAGRLEVLDRQAHAAIERPGIYEFYADQPEVAVVSGRLRVEENDRSIELGTGRELTWSGDAAGHTAKLNRARLAADDLYAWSEQRSQAAADASVNTALALVGTSPDYWRGSGWYWNPFLGVWAFLPSDYSIAGPFGDRFFSARFYGFAARDRGARGYFALAE